MNNTKEPSDHVDPLGAMDMCCGTTCDKQAVKDQIFRAVNTEIMSNIKTINDLRRVISDLEERNKVLNKLTGG